MTTLRGYQVVLRNPSDLRVANAAYRGIDRRPPWSQESFNKGFDDPYVFGDYVDESGLIPTIEQARQLFERLLHLYTAQELETIVAAECTTPNASSKLLELPFLGFDVAGRTSPFFSLVRAFPEQPRVRRFLTALNASGLFSSQVDAFSYLQEHTSLDLPDMDFPLAVWDVHLIE